MTGRPSGFVFAFILILILLSGGAATPAYAIPITVSFQATGFTGVGVPPADPVVGSIVYDAASTTSTINSLTSINLTIAGHTYTVSELDFASVSPNQFIEALTNHTTLVRGNNNFELSWMTPLLGSPSLLYSAVGASDIFLSKTFTQFSVTAERVSVPEPTSLSLLLAGVVSLSVCLYRDRRKISSQPRVTRAGVGAEWVSSRASPFVT
jgi:hypothetical protein